MRGSTSSSMPGADMGGTFNITLSFVPEKHTPANLPSSTSRPAA
ncbi:hypothetical protein BTHI11S_01387 [Bosea thiooxidans]